MREIIFRGKTKNTSGKYPVSTWIYGNYSYNKKYNSYQIYCCGVESVDVYPATIGQYTGLKDANDNEIYEGDILDIGDELVEAIWNECGFAYRNYGYTSNQLADLQDIEVMGNVHDDPELLLESEEKQS
ncbi:phage uncharacterized protein [Candidatus Termititenax aidoneus]|uniref:Phage uncharacterized protein n=1 Tax=Termititenax aidoneus TaxID=2218524 RepID=A0A388TA60_TERA1|nr:phage uncharacterized protein [Candidatus Termititenax aidoneus]